MLHHLHFAKASGAGNDFVVLNSMDERLSVEKPPLARALCDRHRGIGADGLLVLEPSRVADFRMLYFNADGSTGGMCGNGARCAALVAWRSGITGRQSRIEALDFVYLADIGEGDIRLSMKDPEGLRSPVEVRVCEGQYSCHHLDTGAPHLVVFVEDLQAVEVVSVGRSLCHAAQFLPAGTNVDFVHLAGTNAIELRTYERGVEDETLACGTGSVAAAVVSALVHGLQFPVDVRVRSGATLRVHARRSGESVSTIVLEGPAEILFQGIVHYDSSRTAVVAQNQLTWSGTPGGP